MIIIVFITNCFFPLSVGLLLFPISPVFYKSGLETTPMYFLPTVVIIIYHGQSHIGFKIIVLRKIIKKRENTVYI